MNCIVELKFMHCIVILHPSINDAVMCIAPCELRKHRHEGAHALSSGAGIRLSRMYWSC